MTAELDSKALKGRTQEIAPNTFYHESPLEYTDFYRVTVGWSEEDKAWLAQIAGCAHDSACLDRKSVV